MRNLLIYILCIIQILTIFIFYESINTDRVNYLNYARESYEILEFLLNGNIYYFFINEPAWLVVNIILSYFFDIQYVPLAIGLITYLLSVNYVLKKVNKRYILFILVLFLMPQIYKSFLVHLRQGLAIAVYLSAFLVENRRNKYSLIMCSGLIHNSFIPILLIHITYQYFLKKYSTRLIIGFTFTVSIIIGLYLFEIISLFGFRQHNNYDNIKYSVSGLGFIFWGLILFVFLLSNRITLRKNLICIVPLCIYLSFYYINPLSARFLESYLIIIISSITLLPNFKFYVSYLLLFSWSILNNFFISY